MPNHYEVLHSQPSDSFETIKQNYRRLVLTCHPDKSAASNTNPESEVFIRLSEAWNVLKDSAKRRLYDAELVQQQFHAHNVYARVSLSEMETAPDGSLFYNCRCSGQYVLEGLDDFEEGEDEVLVECSECSLGAVVTR